MILTHDVIVNRCPCHHDGSGFHTIKSGTELKIVPTPPEYERHMAESLKRGEEAICALIDGHVVRVPKRFFEDELSWMLG